MIIGFKEIVISIIVGYLIGYSVAKITGRITIGMALMASQRHEELSQLILPIILGTTVFFEILRPVVTKYTIKKSIK